MNPCRPELQSIQKLLEQRDSLDELSGYMIATLSLPQNQQHFHPKLLILAEQWRTRRHKILGKES